MENTLETSLNSEDFKCSNCKNPLSVAPVLSIMELDNEKYLCGRCKHYFSGENSNPKTERQTLYEHIAKKMKFTCRFENDGCKKILNWNEVEKHEQDCEFGKIQCFFKLKEFEESERCRWEGTNEEYFEHLEEHSENIDNIDKLRIWENPKNRVIRIELFHNVLLVFLLFLDNVYHIAMVGKKEEQSVKYRVEMSDESKENFGIFSKISSFLPLDMEQIRKFGLKINPNLLKPEFFSINFINSNICYGTCNAELYPCCDKCKGKLTLPIISCDLKHKFCQRCAGKSNTCGSCPYDYYRPNSLKQCKSLEGEVLSKHYKCGTQNCSFHGNFHELGIHNEFCKFILDKCSKISTLNSPYSMSDSEFFFIFDGTHFKLSKCEINERQFLTVFSLKPTDTDYKMKLDISNSTFTMTFVISPKFSSYSCYSGNSVVIPKSILNQCPIGGENKEYKFKFNISKL